MVKKGTLYIVEIYRDFALSAETLSNLGYDFRLGVEQARKGHHQSSCGGHRQ